MQIILNGLVSGAILALLSTAFTVAYLPTRVFHIALAAVYSLAPYVVLALINVGMPWYVAVPLALILSSFVSASCEFLNHWRLQQKSASEGAHMIASMGLMIILVQAIALIWGNDPQTLRPGADVVYRMFGIMLTRSQAVGLVVSLLAIVGFHIWLQFSNLGLQFRALADDPIELGLWGYNVRRLRILVFAVSGLLAGLASLLTALDLGFDPHMGLTSLLLAVVAMIIGGRGTFTGPLLGGVLLGVMRSEVTWYLSARWQEAITFLLLAIFLVFRPQGLLGRRQRLEAEG